MRQPFRFENIDQRGSNAQCALWALLGTLGTFGHSGHFWAQAQDSFPIEVARLKTRVMTQGNKFVDVYSI